MKKIYVLIAVLFLVSCEENKEAFSDSESLLLGNWSGSVFVNETVTFNRVAELPDEAYGITFQNEGTYIERSYGFCGTPPHIYFNTEGNWQKLNDNLISINMPNTGRSFNWRIISLTEDTLVVKSEMTQQETEYDNIANLFNEIQNIAYSVSCSDASNWLFTAYGSKACGGSQGFIPYSTEIDTEDFLQKVAAYTEAEHQYNIKWGVISTCDVPVEPIGVSCQNGLPILKY